MAKSNTSWYQTTQTFFASKEEQDIALRWLLGIGGTWIILTLLVDLGETSEFAVALALVIMGSVILQYGPEAFQNIGVIPKTGGKDTIDPPVSGAKIWQKG